jgi:hypothetical protein
LRQNSRTVTPEGTDTLRTVTPPEQRIETKQEFLTKNEHARPAFALYRGRSRHPLVRVIPHTELPHLYQIEWPDIGLSDLTNLTRAKAAALEWAECKEAKLMAADRKSLRWSQQDAAQETA